MRNTEIKITVAEKIGFSTTIKQVMERMKEVLAKPLDQRLITVSEDVDLKKLNKLISKTYDCSIRDGVQGGCYGSRDGSQFNGLTVWSTPRK